MGLLSFLQRKPAAASQEGAVDAERRRARRRLMGATLLVALGVVGFPLLFDTAPRPLPVDLPIEIPSKDAVPPLAMGSASQPRQRAASVEPAPAAVASAPLTQPQTESGKTTEKRIEPVPEPVPEPRSEAAAGNGARYVVQVGAYSEAESARQIRARIEKLGLKTYTQVVETSAGKRIRVRLGPYDARSEADKAAQQLKRAGLSPAVMTL